VRHHIALSTPQFTYTYFTYGTVLQNFTKAVNDYYNIYNIVSDLISTIYNS